MFNPCVLVVQQEEKSMDPAELRGKRIGVNKQASVYLQFQQLLSQKHIPETAFREIPVGWSGSELFQAHEIDGLLAYSTNAVVDLDAKGIRYKEFRFGDNELESYGLVLVINSEAAKVQGISEKEIGAFIVATLKGYADGANDLPGAVKAVRDEAPTLDPDKLLLAIKKISKLNSETRYPPDQIDNWVPGISKESRERFRTLLSRGNTHGH
jgi:ABC-type nitrate/sulfonate/bicarbonate transport system substrate-binding protein